MQYDKEPDFVLTEEDVAATTPSSGVAETIMRRRKELGISQAVLAERMQRAGSSHWRQNTVSRVERGSQDVNLEELQHLVAILGPEVMRATGIMGVLGDVRDHIAANANDAPEAHRAAKQLLDIAADLFGYSVKPLGDPELERIATHLNQVADDVRDIAEGRDDG